MYPKKCPVCGADYHDRDEQFSIVFGGACSTCITDSVGRWEDEGGATTNNPETI